MERALDFLRSHRDVAFATVENGKPKIRVFQIMQIDGETLYFATSAKKEVYRQLQANPSIELLAMEGDISVRVGGKADFNVEDAMQRKIYEGSAILQRLYPSYDSMAYFSLKIKMVDYYDLKPTPPLLEHFER